MRFWRWLLYPLGALLLLVGALYLWGSALPLPSSGSHSIEIARPPAAVWAVMMDPARVPAWQPMVKSVKPVSAMVNELTYTDGIVARTQTTLSEPPHRLAERIIADPTVPFRSHWEAQLAPSPTGTRVTFSSTVEIDQPLIRWAQRYLFTMDKALAEMLNGLKREAERT